MPIKSYKQLYDKVAKMTAIPISVAEAADKDVLESIKNAQQVGFIGKAYLCGNKDKIIKIASDIGIDIAKCEIYDAQTEAESAKFAVNAIKQTNAKILVKGSLKTETYLKAILDKENGLKTTGLLSNISVFEMSTYHKLLAITDNAVVIAPTLEEKRTIIENTKALFKALEVDKPKVAILSAVETISTKIPSTLDAASLVMMSQRGQIKGFIIEGPFGYDAIISKDAAIHKGIINSEVVGDADLILCPNIETANALGKSYKFHGNASWGGLVLGASVPAVLNSRSDDMFNRMNSLMLARAISEIL